MMQIARDRIWLYCIDNEEAEWAIRNLALDTSFIVGVSYQTGSTCIFPHSGLTPAMQAAIRGEIDLLMVADLEQVSKDAGIYEILQTFANYNVTVRSFSK